jgi:pimeloyl-ACP methyl ester carboxylesterase
VVRCPREPNELAPDLNAGPGAAAVALGDGLRLGSLAMVAPVPGVVSHARRSATGLGAGERIRDGLLARIERRAGVPLGELDVLALCGLVVTPPTFVVHDRDDAVVPVTEAAAIATSWPGTRLTVTTGPGHRGVLRNAWVVAEVVDFVTGHDPGRG